MSQDQKSRKVNITDTVRVVTANSFVSAKGLQNLSLKARKLLYIAISQCRMNDKGFYEYQISAVDFAKLMEISPSHVYEEGYDISIELIRGYIEASDPKNKNYEIYSLFKTCKYKDGILTFKLNEDMTNFLLALKGSFTKPLISDFLRMKSNYSMAIWHLMQQRMNSQKPGIDGEIFFNITLQELREVTGTQNKLKQIGQFKTNVLDKAIREIRENCGVDIDYRNLKQGRTITGFRFCAKSYPIHLDKSAIKPETINKLRLYELKQIMKTRQLTASEQSEYYSLIGDGDQQELDFGFLLGYD